MRIAITGASGYIGSNLVKSLGGGAHEIHPLSHEASLAAMTEMLKAKRIEAVIHLASLFIADHKSEDVVPLVQGNIQFGAELLEAMRVAGVKKLINTGSSWQYYGSDGFSAACLYAATKSAFGEIGKYYFSAYGMSVINLSIYDVYGPADPRKKIIPHLMRLARAGSHESIDMSPGGQRLHFIHIDDIVHAYATALSLIGAETPHFRSYFLRGDTTVDLRQLVALIEEISQTRLHINWGARAYREREVMAPWEQGEKLPGWKPHLALRDGLREIFNGRV